VLPGASPFRYPRSPGMRSLGMRSPGILLLGPFLLALAGCGNLTAGGFGEVTAELVGDAGNGHGEAQAAATATAAAAGLAGSGELRSPPAPAWQPGGVPSIHGANQGGPPGQGPGPRSGPPSGPRPGPGGGAFQGEVTVELQLLVRDGAGDWVELTDGVQLVEVDASGNTAVPFAAGSFPHGNLDRARVIFHRAEVLVTGGPPGLGVPVGERLEVDFGGAPTLVLERPLSGRVGDDPLRLRVNLRSGVWIRAAVLGRVPGQSFQSAVQVEVLDE
jgi:hypothetical protein